MARLISSWRMLVHIPAAMRQGDEGFTAKDFLIIIKRANESRYYEKYAEQQVCGCYAIGNHYTSYLMDCELHGWDAIFPEYKRE